MRHLSQNKISMRFAPKSVGMWHTFSTTYYHMNIAYTHNCPFEYPEKAFTLILDLWLFLAE